MRRPQDAVKALGGSGRPNHRAAELDEPYGVQMSNRPPETLFALWVPARQAAQQRLMGLAERIAASQDPQQGDPALSVAPIDERQGSIVEKEESRKLADTSCRH